MNMIRTMNATQLTPTYFIEDNSEIRNSFSELDKALQDNDKPEIAALYDKDNNNYLIYSGNIVYYHALKRDYPLNVCIIKNQEELNEFDKKNKRFKEINFNEALSNLRILSKKNISQEELEILRRKQARYEVECIEQLVDYYE